MFAALERIQFWIDGDLTMDRRELFLGLLFVALTTPTATAFAKDGDDSSSGRGSDKDNDIDERDDDRGDDDDDRQSASSAVDRGEIAPLSVILRIALAHTPGKVIDVKLDRKGSSYIYRIKILTRQGRKRELQIDARAQKIVRVK